MQLTVILLIAFYKYFILKILDNERLEVNDTMIDRYVEDANDKGDLSLNVIDVLYYVPKVRTSINKTIFTIKEYIRSNKLSIITKNDFFILVIP